jgi:hypothetical protein
VPIAERPARCLQSARETDLIWTPFRSHNSGPGGIRAAFPPILIKSQPIFYTFNEWGKERGWGRALGAGPRLTSEIRSENFRDARHGPATIRAAAPGPAEGTIRYALSG